MYLWCFIRQGTSLKNAFLANVVQVNTQMEQMCERKTPPSEFPLLVPFVWWGFWHLVFGPLTGWLRCAQGGRGSLTVPCYRPKNSVSRSFPSSAPAHQTIHRFCVSRPEDGIVCAITKPCFWRRVSGMWMALCAADCCAHSWSSWGVVPAGTCDPEDHPCAAFPPSCAVSASPQHSPHPQRQEEREGGRKPMWNDIKLRWPWSGEGATRESDQHPKCWSSSLFPSVTLSL